MQKEAAVRRHICFYGQVQGVGFRFTAMQLAQGLGLTGWVRNADDYAEMEVQGLETEIHRLLAGLQENPWIQIERMETKELSLETKERRFRLEW